jgi:hypothetical protein
MPQRSYRDNLTVVTSDTQRPPLPEEFYALYAIGARILKMCSRALVWQDSKAARVVQPCGAFLRGIKGDQLVCPGSMGSVKNDVSVTPLHTPVIRITPWAGRH